MAEIKFEVVITSLVAPEVVTQKIRDILRECSEFNLVSVGFVEEEMDSGKGLPKKHLHLLKKFYVDFNVTTDRLAAQVGTLSEFAQRFNVLAKSEYPASTLIKRLMILRKNGKLPRIRKNTEELGI